MKLAHKFLYARICLTQYPGIILVSKQRSMPGNVECVEEELHNVLVRAKLVAWNVEYCQKKDEAENEGWIGNNSIKRNYFEELTKERVGEADGI